MKFDIYQPCQQLIPYVKHFVITENDEARSYKVMPDTSLVMGFQYSGRVSYTNNHHYIKLAASGVTGLLDAYRIFNNTPVTNSVLVVFKEDGAGPFFDRPLHELFRESLSLENFCPQTVLSEVEDKLALAKDDHERIVVIEQFLIARFRPSKQDLLVKAALQHIHQSKGTIRIADLAQTLHTSPSPLEKRFRQAVGASPKKFASVVRVKNMITALNKNNDDFAYYLAGFYDQAHFIKSFKNFTAETPDEYLKTLRNTTLK